MTLAFLLRDAASRFPNKPAHGLKDRVLTYAELDTEALRLARRLIACGTKPGDRVALHMHNGAEIAIAYFACFLGGAIAVPINARMKVAEIEYVLEHSGCSIYLGQGELFQEIAEIKAINFRAEKSIPPCTFLPTSGINNQPRAIGWLVGRFCNSRARPAI